MASRDVTSPALVEATALVMRVLAGPVASESNPEELSREGAVRIAAGWAFVHGLAVLSVEKRSRGVSMRAPAFAELHDLLDAALDGVTSHVEA